MFVLHMSNAIYSMRRKVYTKLTEKILDGPDFTAPTPDAFVQSDLRSITKIQVTSGYWFHNLMVRSESKWHLF